MLSFPTDREPEKWHLLLDAEEVNRQWRTEFALMVWEPCRCPGVVEPGNPLRRDAASPAITGCSTLL